jgi:hypothetical protein
VVDFAALVDDADAEVERLAGVLGLEWPAMPEVGDPRGFVLQPAPARLSELEPELQRLLPQTIGLAEAAHDLVAAPVSRRPTATPDFDAATRSVHTAGFARLLDRFDSSLLLTTGDTGKLVCVRYDGARVNTHFEDVPGARAVAADGAEFAVLSGDELVRYRREDAVAGDGAGFAPAERLPAAGAAAIAFAGGELWRAVEDRLERLDGEPLQLRPAADGNDAMRITGIAVADGTPAYVSVARAEASGAIIECATGTLLAEGLEAPLSPRVHEDRLWVVEGEASRLVALDLESGERVASVELPGTAGGLVIAGSVGFVALSEPASGLSVVDLVRAELGSYLRFEGAVPEVSDVAVLPYRYPEIRGRY